MKIRWISGKQGESSGQFEFPSANGDKSEKECPCSSLGSESDGEDSDQESKQGENQHSSNISAAFDKTPFIPYSERVQNDPSDGFNGDKCVCNDDVSSSIKDAHVNGKPKEISVVGI